MELDVFCQVFHQYTSMILKQVVSELGCANELNKKIVYKNSKIGKYLFVLDNEFNKMYEVVCSEQKILVDKRLMKLAFDYFAEFRIFVTEVDGGIRYDIPL